MPTDALAEAAGHSHSMEEPSVSFAELGLSKPLLRGIDKLGWTQPTKVQRQMIPLALAGRDILGQSKTGTGKTAAFGAPILQRLSGDTAVEVLILVPTRELAMQVGEDLRDLARFTPAQVVTVYGGQRIRIQADRLQKRPSIVVGTPGRVMDMHGRGLLPYDNVRFAVLDEVDRMLDIGFRDDIRRILGAISHDRQTIFVSATISAEIERLARQYMRNPEKLVATESERLTVSEVNQRYFNVEPWDKKRLLVHLLTHEEPAVTLIFCRTKQTVDALAQYLIRKGIDAHAIHGDMYQGQRTRVMTRFKRGELSVLVASDLAARGLDVADISHVINYDLPEDPEIYVHRVGRTARAGRKGEAWSFITPDQGGLLTTIEQLAGVITCDQYSDFKPGPVPADITAQRQRAIERQEELRVEYSRVPLAPPKGDTAIDKTKFPGGVVPTSLPARRLGGRLRSRRR